MQKGTNFIVPRISILIPVFNGMPFLCEAIKSVISQNFSEWEMLIGDNGSNDGTVEYLDGLKDIRIRLFKHPKNLGIYGNLNFLIENANCPIAQILCADDMLLPNSLAKIVNFMEVNSNCALSRCLDHDEWSKRLAVGRRDQLEGGLPTDLKPESAILAFATFGNIVGSLSKAAFRPSAVIEVGKFNTNFPYAGDWEGWIRVASRFGINLNNEELVYCRIHPNQNTFLLNRNNELYPQINKILYKLVELTSNEDHKLLIKQWRTNFMLPRVSRFLKLFLTFNFKLNTNPLRQLPLGISIYSILFEYGIWKCRLPRSKKNGEKLLIRIQEINKKY